MTVDEYRKKHPHCAYCVYYYPAFNSCRATRKIIKKRTAKKCPCYIPEKWSLKKGSDTE